MRRFLPVLAAAFLCACGNDTTSEFDALHTREIRLPDGRSIRAEVMVTPFDMQRGMMFRDSLPSGRGMLFLHDKPQDYRYWMYQVKIPLDIVFIDGQHRVLGISADTPPCKTKASECPTYGGFPGTLYVLELGAGEARKHAIQPGSIIPF